MLSWELLRRTSWTIVLKGGAEVPELWPLGGAEEEELWSRIEDRKLMASLAFSTWEEENPAAIEFAPLSATWSMVVVRTRARC